MKKLTISLLLLNISLFASAEKVINLYNAGKFQEAAKLAATLDKSNGLNYYARGITEKTGNEAASLYRKALVSGDLPKNLTENIYSRLANYYGIIGIPGSVTVMLQRARNIAASVTAVKEKESFTVGNEVLQKNLLPVNLEEEVVSGDPEVMDFGAAEEKDLPGENTKTVPVKSVEPNGGPKVFYVLQTGAFGLKSNAEKMEMKLKRNFEKVTVKKHKSGDRTLYKVMVGRFASQDEALKFGTAKLRTKNIKFRIVKE